MALDRRAALLLASSGAATLGASPVVAQTRQPRGRGSKTVFVLVHGAWHGGWCWRDVRTILEQAGHRVITPTLTGLGERGHLRDPIPGLETHIQDVIGVIEAEEVTDIVLVGHSYAGMVITGVADTIKNKIKHIVYLDAALPENGQSMITQNPAVATPEAIAQNIAGLKSLAPDGEWMAPLPAFAFGIPPSQTTQLAWVNRRLTAHPLKSWTDTITLANGGSAGLARSYILCVDPILPQTAFPAHAAKIKAGGAGPNWRVQELKTGHDAMVSDPAGTARLLLAAAR